MVEWEQAYREYAAAYQREIRAPLGDPASAAAMSRAYQRVAAAWRQLADSPGVQWWARAAAITAAEEFSRQARIYHSKVMLGEEQE